MNNIDLQYQTLLQDILDNRVTKQTRNGKTISVFGRQIRHKMSEGFPLLTTKKMAIKSLMTELKWFLKGRTDIRYLNENGCKIWNGDAYSKYERACLWELERPEYTEEEFIQRIMEDDDFNRVWGQLGPIYGKQWRRWENETVNYSGSHYYHSYVDQIENLINELKNNPDSRRLMVNAWNVGQLHEMTLPPCHYGFQVYTRELSIQERMRLGNFEFGEVVNDEMCDKQGIPRRELSLMWNQRSIDTFLGLPFNIASYGMLLHLLANEVNMVPGELIGNLGDTHLYEDHIEQAKQQLKREPYELPTLKLISSNVLDGEFEYEIEGYKSHPTIKAPLLN